MHYLVLVTVLFSSLFLTACGPAAIVGAIGSAITRTAYENDAEIQAGLPANLQCIGCAIPEAA